MTNQDKLWDYFQNDQTGVFSNADARLTFLVDQIRTFKPDGKVLDIGIGDGTLARIAHQSGLNIHCLDPSERSIAAIRDSLDLREKAQVGYGQKIPFSDGYFDAIVLSEVIEHLSEEVTHQTVQEVARVLKSTGRVFVTVPARENLQDSMVICPKCDEVFHRWGHIQSFTPEKLITAFAENFKVITATERPFINWSTLNLKGKVDGITRLFLWRCGIHGSGENIYLCVQKSA